MTDFGTESGASGRQNGAEGATQEELLQRIARLEGAMEERRRYWHGHRPWWMGWVMVWLLISLFHGFGGWGWNWEWGGHCIWPSGILAFVLAMCVLREIRWHRGNGGKGW
ncbi:MAG TPA: hypothetical protein VNU94_06400 [Acidobacteriaceae bacterium]|nr:hypothetical protein [Acidobacteriaceae bacterium]